MFRSHAQCGFKLQVVHCNLSPIQTIQHSNITPNNLPPPYYLSVQAGVTQMGTMTKRNMLRRITL